jgi:bifunctional non-homologous end joining protein LigD
MADERTTVVVEGRQLELSNLSKVMYPATGFTKGQVIDYYVRVAPVLLAHLAERPLTLVRYPNGVDGAHFYEKRCPPHAPDWVTTAPVPSGSKGDIIHVVCDSLPTLVWLANLAALELHPLLARSPRLDHPTMLMFDLDPGAPADVLTAAEVALDLRQVLVDAGASPVVKTTGSKGLHLVVPLDATTSYEILRPLARQVAQAMERRAPKRCISVQDKVRRAGKVLVDWNQNGLTNTTAAAYSLRARTDPTVSTPVTWDEVDQAVAARDASQLRFTSDQVLARIADRGDLWTETPTAGHEELGRLHRWASVP